MMNIDDIGSFATKTPSRSMIAEGALHQLIWRVALALWLSSGLYAARVRRESADPIEINRVDPVSAWPLMEPLTYDCELSVQAVAGGAIWAAWKTYHAGVETIVGRLVRDRQQERFIEITRQPGICAAPRVVAFDERRAWFFWSQQQDGKWTIMGRRRQEEGLEAEQRLSPGGIDAVGATATRQGPDGVCLAWQALIKGKMTIQTRHFDGRQWGPAQTVSRDGCDAFRPVAVTTGGAAPQTWVVWDEYHKPNYEIYARRIGPERGAIERISPPGVYAVKPEVLAPERGELWVTWVHSLDVQGGDAVIDQSNFAQVAVNREGRWQLQSDASGTPDLLCLDYGLLAHVAPKPIPTGGYLGERRKPMLLADGEAVWLVHERKADETGVTTAVTGDLVGRKFEGGNWGELKTLAQGFLEYRAATEASVGGKWIFTASRLPREHRRIYEKMIVDAHSATLARDERVGGWTPVQLPLPGRSTVRRNIQNEGRTLQLYWMDTHVHSALSADAEGEPDEILHYARDRAQLDVVVVQENDDIYDVPLTQAEYATGVWLARWASAGGDLLALPGFEWTQILPTGVADPARPQFWTGSFRNHRTTIYPLSGGPIVRYTEVGNDINRLYSAVRQSGGVTHTQHPTFELTHDDSVEPAIEVTAGWGIYFLNPGRIHAALNDGYRKAFVGTSDSHRRNPGLGGGLTGVYAEDRTDKKILEAYRDRRVFATTGARVMIDARLNGILMGREVKVLDTAKLTLHVEAPRPIRRVALIGGGAELKSFPGEARTILDLSFEDPNRKPGATWFYWRVELEGPGTNYQGNAATAEGNLAWSSPLWAIRGP